MAEPLLSAEEQQQQQQTPKDENKQQQPPKQDNQAEAIKFIKEKIQSSFDETRYI